MPLFSKIAYSHGCNVFTVGTGRFLFGILGSAVVIALVPKLTFRIQKQQVKAIFLLSLPFSATTMLLYGSYTFIGSGLATTLHFTYPVIVMVIGAVAFSMKLTPKQTGCLLLCTGGIICLNPSDVSGGFFGIAIALLSGVTYAIYILMLGKSHLGDIPVLTITFWLSLFSFVEMMIFTTSTGNLVIPTAWQSWTSLACLGLSASVAAVALFQAGVFRCGEVKSSLLSTFEPLTSVIVGIIAFREVLTPLAVCGIALILLSTVLLVVAPKKKLVRQ